MKMYAVECYPQGWEEPFKREMFDEKQRAFNHATLMNLYYPTVRVYEVQYIPGQLGSEQYLIKTLKSKRA